MRDRDVRRLLSDMVEDNTDQDEQENGESKATVNSRHRMLVGLCLDTISGPGLLVLARGIYLASVFWRATPSLRPSSRAHRNIVMQVFGNGTIVQASIAEAS
jgi:hypothetical protein